MKTATFPPLRVDPQLRRDTENVLRDGESLSQFIEQAVRSQVELRKANEAFLARGLASSGRARQTGRYVDADVVLEKLHVKLDAAKVRTSRS
ncbi:YlcI/YnfO family protein [Castellaniella caeni]|uniref:YlcI/YnfO family protein n=1 Tax=Castellaniella caeni TaxID=266123 RepID=UPI000C9F38CB|nr:YlcI/YnfO family protein [Castellaniella caeni]